MPRRKSIKKQTKIQKKKKTKKNIKRKQKQKQKGGVKCLTVENGEGANATPDDSPDIKYAVKTIVGSSQSIANSRKYEGKIFLLVAGNAGRPGGALGAKDGSGIAKDEHGMSKDYTIDYKTQEESIVASWLQWEKKYEETISGGTFDADKKFATYLGNKTILSFGDHGATKKNRPWGMVNPYGKDTATLQGHDFTLALDDSTVNNYNFAYILRDTGIVFNKVKNIPVNIVFVYGPNVNAGFGKLGETQETTVRTKVKTGEYKFNNHYKYFRKAIEIAIKAGLQKMIDNKDDNKENIAILAPVSGGIYSGNGRTNKKINKDYKDIINTILNEKYKDNKIGSYFKEVIFPRMPPKK